MKNLKLFLISLICCALFIVTSAHAQKKEKVILDTDMVEVFDDGIAMMMLANAPGIDLLGVTVVVGNTWVNEGVAYGIRQLEIIGKEHIPVISGVREPIFPSRFETIKNERILFGIGDAYVGAAGYPEPITWESVYYEKYGTEPTAKPLDMNAVNYIIEQVKNNPGEISIIAIGTCVNLAMAVRIAPEIVPLVKRVIYMGGSFFKPGNTTPAAEFNWWLDPEAAKMCLRTPFKEQIIVGLDVCETMPLKKDRYDEIINLTKNAEIKSMLKRNFLYSLYYKDPTYVHYIWDVIAAAIMIDPTLITEGVTRYVDVNSQFGFSYGQSIAYENNQPAGTQQARIILKVDNNRLWKMVDDYIKDF